MTISASVSDSSRFMPALLPLRASASEIVNSSATELRICGAVARGVAVDQQLAVSQRIAHCPHVGDLLLDHVAFIVDAADDGKARRLRPARLERARPQPAHQHQAQRIGDIWVKDEQHAGRKTALSRIIMAPLAIGRDAGLPSSGGRGRARRLPATRMHFHRPDCRSSLIASVPVDRVAAGRQRRGGFADRVDELQIFHDAALPM